MNEENKYNPSDFDEYIRQGEPDTQQKAYNWQTAIGLQAVDGLRTSDYLLQTARQHIEGQIDMEEVQVLLKSYYQNRSSRLPDEQQTEEADRVAANITRILSTRTLQIDMEEVQVLLKSYYQNRSSRLPDEQQTEEADRVAANITRILSTRTLAFNTNGYVALHRQIFEGVSSRLPDEQQTEEADRVAANITRILSTRTLAFNTNGYVALHRQIFEGVFKFAGQIRDYDISKKEWVLRGDTVSYLNYQDLRAALDYDIQQERDFDYSGLNMQQIVAHIARFVAGLWQIHAFGEGNTRTTAVFTIQYLRSIGFDSGLNMQQIVAHIARFVAGLWQIHAFGEGNTRTTAVFTIQYLRSIGFDINNSLFARHSWYFRNALVRANYKNAQRGIMYDFSFLEKFFRNLLLGEDNGASCTTSAFWRSFSATCS